MTISRYQFHRIFCGLMFTTIVSCANTRRAGTAVGQAIDNPLTYQHEWGEVYCGKGTVCAEIDVRRVDIEARDGGRIEVTLHNRTSQQAGLSISLEILDNAGARLDSTNFEQIAIQPRQEKRWTMPGIYREGAKVRVVLRPL